MAKAILDVNQQQKIIFEKLLVELKGHLNIPELFSSFKTLMKPYLSAAELNTEDLLEICNALERGGHIAPDNLKILKDAVQTLDVPAFEKILIAEKEIRLKGTIGVTVHTRNVEPPDQEHELQQNVVELTNLELRNIIDQTDNFRRLERFTEFNTQLEKFTHSMARIGVTFQLTTKKSLEFLFRYNSQAALKRLWALYTSGKLLDMIKNGIFTPSLLQLCHVTSLDLEVYISVEEYEYCLKNADEISESKVLGHFNFSVDEESIKASEKKYHSVSEQSQEWPIQEESTDEEMKHSKEKAMLSTATKPTVEAVSDVIQHAKVTIQDFVHKTENTHLPEFYEAVKNVEDECFRNESYYTNVIANIKKQNENLKLELDKTTNKMVGLCREYEKQNEDIIKTHKAELQSQIEELNVRVKEMKDTLQTGTDTQIYETSREIPNEVTIPALPSLKTMDSNPTTILIDQLERSFGHSKNICKDVVDKNKLFKSFRHPLDIYRIKASSNVNQVWLRDLGSKLELLANTGQIQKKMEMEVAISDFCVSPSTGDIWFCSYRDKSVRKVTADNKSKVMFHTDSEPVSMCISAEGNVLVGMERQIVKYTQRGQILCKSTQVKPVPVVRRPDSISQCPVTRNIAVLDCDYTSCGGDDKEHVSILSEDLQLLCRYYGRDIERFNPCDVCYSDTGDIYIADRNNRSIQQISGTGQYIQSVYTDSHKPAVYLCVQSNGDIWAVFRYKYVIILQKQ